jgi:competence protein ComEA
MVSLTRKQIALVLVPVVALLVVAGQRLAGVGTGEAPVQAEALVPLSGGGGTGEPAARVAVHVSGAVRKPGLYTIDDGSRVADVVARAGGLKPRADLTALNLAAPVVDGQHVIVPRRVAPGSAAAGAASATGPVQLSVATVEQLDELPGIGPVTAQKIVDWRTAHGAFQSVDDLDEIPGIGPARIEQLRDLVVP